MKFFKKPMNVSKLEDEIEIVKIKDLHPLDMDVNRLII
jgi:hypothetical protein